MDTQAILRRVKKLLAIAADSRGDPNETAAAAAQAENLMRKFNIENADLLREDLRQRGAAAMATARVKVNMKRDDAGRTPLKRAPRWAGWLAVALARLNDANVAYVRDESMGGVVAEFRGFEVDVQVAAWMFDYLVGQMILAVRAYGADVRKETGSAPAKTQSDAFRLGFVRTLVARITDLKAARDAEVDQSASGRALVVCKQALVDGHFGEAAYKAQKRSAVVRDADAHAYLAGSDRATRVSLERRAVGASTGASVALLGG